MQSDAITEEQKAAFQLWLNTDRAHRRAFEEASRLWTELGALKRAPIDHLRAHPQSNHNAAQSSWLPFRRYTWQLAVSSLIVIVVLGLALRLAIPNDVSQLLETATGEVRMEELTDGSKVTLGAKSSILVEMAGDERRVTLLSGTAYFDVTKEIRPFTVSSGLLRVEVTGTEFAVTRSSRGAQVAVAEGSVEVNVMSGSAAAKALGQGQRINLRLGQLGAVEQIAPDHVGAWRRNRLVYDEALVGELVADLERYTDKPIRLLDSTLAAETITVTFESTEIDLILSTLSQLYSLEVAETESRIELRSKW